MKAASCTPADAHWNRCVRESQIVTPCRLVRRWWLWLSEGIGPAARGGERAGGGEAPTSNAATTKGSRTRWMKIEGRPMHGNAKCWSWHGCCRRRCRCCITLPSSMGLLPLCLYLCLHWYAGPLGCRRLCSSMGKAVGEESLLKVGESSSQKQGLFLQCSGVYLHRLSFWRKKKKKRKKGGGEEGAGRRKRQPARG